MIRKITLFFVVTIIAVSSSVAQSFTALYAFDSVKPPSTNPPFPGTGLTDPSPVPTATGITFGSFSAVGNSFTNPNASGRFSFTDWSLGAVANNNNYSSLTGALSTAQYYEVTLTPSMGYTATLTGIVFKVQRSGTGIRTYAVRSSIDTYAANLPASIIPANANLSVQTGDIFFWNYDSLTSGQNGSTVTLSGADYTNVTNPLTFRFYGWNAEGSGGTFSIDTVIFTGSVSGTTAINITSQITSAIVYPNPSINGLFTLNTIDFTDRTTVTIYNIIGNVVLTKESERGGKEMIDLSNQPNGSYFVNIKNDKTNITKKIAINK